MSYFEELKEIRDNVKHVHDPIILFHMNQKARILEDKIKETKSINVNFELIKN